MNSKPDSKIVSWWDYGYQIAGMSTRAVIVDNNTWNTTHIATVGASLATDEEESFRICKMLDANYVLIIFGGYSGYSGDDINKLGTALSKINMLNSHIAVIGENSYNWITVYLTVLQSNGVFVPTTGSSSSSANKSI